MTRESERNERQREKRDREREKREGGTLDGTKDGRSHRNSEKWMNE